MNHAQFWGGGGAAPYEIEQSLRFDGTGRLSRSMGAGSRTTATISCWIKSDFYRTFFIDAAGGSSNSLETSIYMSTSSIGVGRYDSSWGQVNGDNRDPAAWYHVMWVLDTNNSTGSDRIRVYVNGVRRTFSFSFTPSQGENLGWNNSAPVYIGHRQQIPTSSGDYYWGYLAEMHHVDGTALDPTDFGEFDDNNVWRPIEVSGLTYGTNGFYLKFDPTATNGIGHDHSGEGNHFTPTGFTTSGTGTDVMSDTPTTNYPTLNPIYRTPPYPTESETGTLSNGNLAITFTGVNGGNGPTFSVVPNSGKWYFEAKQTSTDNTNIALGFFGNYTASFGNAWRVVHTNGGGGFFYSFQGPESGSEPSGTVSYSSGDILGIEIDMDNSTLQFHVNGTYATKATGLSFASYAPLWIDFRRQNSSGTNNSWLFNFGQRAFEYTPTSGFKALNTANLPAPDIADGSKNFNTVLWSGNNVDGREIDTGLAPDLIWVKTRNQTNWNWLTDSVRGAPNKLYSNDTSAEDTTPIYGQADSFTDQGWIAGGGTDPTNPLSDCNQTGTNYVCWSWLAGGSGSSNTDGSIPSTVSANPTAGFSIVTWTSPSSGSFSVGHGLGDAPQMVITKSRTASFGWSTYHVSVGNNAYLELNSASNAISSSGLYSMSNTTATFGSAYANGTNYVAYCFAEIAGYSKAGKWSGNSSTDGPFVFLGFKPSFLLWKAYDTNTEYWWMQDSARNTYNVTGTSLTPNESLAEQSGTVYYVDFLSNGFKMRSSHPLVNSSSYNYLYFAFAENPFGGSGVSPATAR